MHCHHGIFNEAGLAAGGNVSDAAADAAAGRAAKVLYSFVPRGGAVLDVGAGFCGTASQLQAGLGCKVAAVAAPAAEAAVCGNRGFEAQGSVVEAAAAAAAAGSRFDAALLVESLSRFSDKAGVLSALRGVADRLVLRTHTFESPDGVTPTASDTTVFGGAMTLAHGHIHGSLYNSVEIH